LPLKHVARLPHFTKANASRAGSLGRNKKIASEPIDLDACRSANLHICSTGGRCSRRGLDLNFRYWHIAAVPGQPAEGRL
jgi:hypothetical protein